MPALSPPDIDPRWFFPLFIVLWWAISAFLSFKGGWYSLVKLYPGRDHSPEVCFDGAWSGPLSCELWKLLVRQSESRRHWLVDFAEFPYSTSEVTHSLDNSGRVQAWEILVYHTYRGLSVGTKDPLVTQEALGRNGMWALKKISTLAWVVLTTGLTEPATLSSQPTSGRWTIMSDGKWVEFTPMGYLGIGMGLCGILVPYLLDIHNSLIQLLGFIISCFGGYLAFKSKKEHGLWRLLFHWYMRSLYGKLGSWGQTFISQQSPKKVKI